MKRIAISTSKGGVGKTSTAINLGAGLAHKGKNSQPFKIRLKSKLDVENVELGMNPDEVIKVAGKPHYIVEWYTGNLKYNYGNSWVIIENGAVTCLVHAKDFGEYWGRSDYERENPRAIIK